VRIGVLGAGAVGQALASGYARHGHETRIGNRAGDVDGTFAEVADWAELVVLAVKGEVAVQVVDAVSTKLAGKVVVDATNPLDGNGGTPRLFVGFDDSLGERVQRAAPAARVVKALNTVNNAAMVDPSYTEGRATMLYAGDDPDAKATVDALLRETGWDTVDLGGIEASRELESLCLAWVRIGLAEGRWDHAFAVLRG
jgi:8-hydroxy-5-deazaflavin:NADPH oxidoreductase